MEDGEIEKKNTESLDAEEQTCRILYSSYDYFLIENWERGLDFVDERSLRIDFTLSLTGPIAR